MRWSRVAIWSCGAIAALDPAGLVGGKRRQALIGEFRLAHDRLLLGAHLGELGALARDVVAHGGELAFEFGGGRKRGQRALGLGLGGGRFVAAADEARARLGQRGEPRRLAVEVAFARARLGLGVARGIEGRLRGIERLALFVDLGAGRHQFAVDLGKAAALREAPGRAGRGVRGRDITIPAPEIAFARNQPLAGFERCGEPGAGFAVDHADLRQPAGELRRRLDEARERLGAFRQCRIAGVGCDFRPVHGRRGIDRRVEIVAQRRAQRLLVALVDRDMVDHRRPQVARLQRQHLAEGLGLGLQPLHALFGFAQVRRARLRDPRAHCCARPRRRPRRLPPRSAPPARLRPRR